MPRWCRTGPNASGRTIACKCKFNSPWPNRSLIASFPWASNSGAQYPASPLQDQVDQHLGRGYLKQKQYAKAIKILKPLTRIASLWDLPAEAGNAPENPASHTGLEPEVVLQTNQYYLGLAYLGDQQYEAALEALAKVQTSPDNQE